ncbi:unnamed protein product [Cuscuta campestris]|uniref:Uncharacterized protein n=1 Tax=Cuscuta campestris TaxID=132261 RepID=A0A484LZ59_9ASTE|nr:unnamed protein product [Cuscuta campestris]
MQSIFPLDGLREPISEADLDSFVNPNLGVYCMSAFENCISLRGTEDPKKRKYRTTELPKNARQTQTAE